MKILTTAMTILFLNSLVGVSPAQANADDTRLQQFISERLEVLEPKIKAAHLASWAADSSGEKKYYDETATLELEIKNVFANRDDFAYLKKLKGSGSIADPFLRRQLTVLYDDYLQNQIDSTLQKTIVEKETAISQQFNIFRGKIAGREMSDNEIWGILKHERDNAKRRQAWEASKQVGREAAAPIIELVKLRNQAARQLGFQDYYELSVVTGEQDLKEIETVFDELKRITDEPFKNQKQKLDAMISARLGVKPEDLRPWHYANPFFQEVSEMGEVDLDSLFQGKDPVAIARVFYAGIDLPVDDILKRSDLYPRPGKYQHAYCTDIDRRGDVRTMCNMADNYYWMNTILHELGHGVYDKYINPKLPFLLLTSTHSLITEGIALMMGRQSANVDWISEAVGTPRSEVERYRSALDDNLRMSELVFARWSLVMFHFERSLYADPDQDLNKLWWDLVEEYQFVKRPEGRNEPDWAAKIHLANSPCYYHNYILGEMAASQIMNTIVRKVMKQDHFNEISFANHPQIGAYLKDKVFSLGAGLEWQDLMKEATGESLTARYFAEEFVGK